MDQVSLCLSTFGYTTKTIKTTKANCHDDILLNQLYYVIHRYNLNAVTDGVMTGLINGHVDMTWFMALRFNG